MLFFYVVQVWLYEHTRPDRVLIGHHPPPPRYLNGHLTFRKDEEFAQVIQSMDARNFIVGGVFPYPEEGWIFIGEGEHAKSFDLSPNPAPAQVNLMAIVSLNKTINLLCKLAFKNYVLQDGQVKSPSFGSSSKKGKGNNEHNC